MTAKGSKSKRLSESNSRATSQPSRIVFLLDRCLGCYDVPRALNEAGIATELHKRHFNSDTPDEHWLAVAGERGWAVITKDGKFRSRQVEIAALLRGSVASFVLTSGSATGPDNGKSIIAAMPQMLGLIAKLDAPFIAKITAGGAVEVIVTREKLRRLVHQS